MSGVVCDFDILKTHALASSEITEEEHYAIWREEFGVDLENTKSWPLDDLPTKKEFLEMLAT